MSTPIDNSTTTSGDSQLQIACVYALSGQYGTLPRWLYYVTVVLAIFGRNREWLVIGALVSSLAYAATAAIHVMALVTSKAHVFDLDALGVWAILSTAALSYIAMIHWSSTIRNSKARIVMVIWGALIGLGLIFNRVTIYDQPFDDYENACYSSDGMLLTSPLQLIKTEFNCTYKCFDFQKPMRGTDEIVAVPKAVIDNGYFKLSLILLGPVMYATYAAITWDTREHTPSQLCTRAVMKYLNPKHKEDLVKMVWNASNESWYGGYFALFHYIRKSPWSVRKAALWWWVYPWILLGLIMDILCLPFLVANVILNELHLLRAGIPTNEAMYNVGQWAPVVNSALVVLAAILNKGLEVREERKARKKKEVTTQEHVLQRVDTEATLVEEMNDDSRARSKGHEYPPNTYLGRSRTTTDNESRLV